MHWKWYCYTGSDIYCCIGSDIVMLEVKLLHWKWYFYTESDYVSGWVGMKHDYHLLFNIILISYCYSCFKLYIIYYKLLSIFMYFKTGRDIITLEVILQHWNWYCYTWNWYCYTWKWYCYTRSYIATLDAVLFQ